MYWSKVYEVSREWMMHDFQMGGFSPEDIEFVINLVGEEEIFAGDVFSPDCLTLEEEVPEVAKDVTLKILFGYAEDEWFIDSVRGKIDSNGNRYVDFDDVSHDYPDIDMDKIV